MPADLDERARALANELGLDATSLGGDLIRAALDALVEDCARVADREAEDEDRRRFLGRGDSRVPLRIATNIRALKGAR